MLYYLEMADVVAKNSNCLRRKYGCVLVNSRGEVIATGYNSSPEGVSSCEEQGVCIRERLNIKSGHRYELCKSIHAETSAILQVGLERARGCHLFLSGIEKDGSVTHSYKPCFICSKFIRQAGIKAVVTRVPLSVSGTGFKILRPEELQISGDE